MKRIFNLLESKRKYASKILLVIIVIIVVYCLIPKWEYVFVRQKTDKNSNIALYQHTLYRYNKITGKIQRYDFLRNKWFSHTSLFSELFIIDYVDFKMKEVSPK